MIAMVDSVALDPDRLRDLLVALFKAAGCETVEARAVATHLVDADLTDHPSHGAGLTAVYVANLRSGAARADRRLERVPLASELLLFDGGKGFGQSLGLQLVDEVLAKCSVAGSAVFGLRNVHHLGRIGDYGERLASAGHASVIFVNTVSRPIVAPFGGAEARMGTNPICIAVPRRGEDPVVLDFATSAIAVGKCRVALEKGKSIPPGVALDALGSPTTDPQALYSQPQGALRAMGGHKGSGLNLVCELLAACIGGLTMPEARPALGGVVNSMVGMCFSAAALPEAYARIESVLAYFLATRADSTDGPVELPGSPERAARARLARSGVPMAAATWAGITKLAHELGVPAPNIDAVPRTDRER